MNNKKVQNSHKVQMDWRLGISLEHTALSTLSMQKESAITDTKAKKG